MGSKGGDGASAPPPETVTAPPRPPPVCCMCGDEGLIGELFHCGVCQTRSQHKYCSHLYPKAESYAVCNWCLREQEAAASSRRKATATTVPPPPAGPSHHQSAAAANDHKPPPPTLRRRLPSPEASNAAGGGASNPATKKQRAPAPLPLRRSSSEVVLRVRSPSSPSLDRHGFSSATAAMDMTARRPFRGRVRRYKLLEEVSS